jgi:glycosyltransferase involved in cell wall biosynthesis
VCNLKAEARAAGAGGNIEFVGFLGRNEIAEAYRAADVFCSPAQNEPGVANVYIEAMASGCPVVAANTGGAPEAIMDGVNGMLVPPNNPEATAAAIDRILSNPALRRDLSLAARRRVDEYFAMDRYITRVLSTYEEAIRRVGDIELAAPRS